MLCSFINIIIELESTRHSVALKIVFLLCKSVPLCSYFGSCHLKTIYHHTPYYACSDISALLLRWVLPSKKPFYHITLSLLRYLCSSPYLPLFLALLFLCLSLLFPVAIHAEWSLRVFYCTRMRLFCFLLMNYS